MACSLTAISMARHCAAGVTAKICMFFACSVAWTMQRLASQTCQPRRASCVHKFVWRRNYIDLVR